MSRFDILAPASLTSGMTLASYVQSAFIPQADITAHDLAVLLPYLLGKGMVEEDWAALGSANRHLKRG